VKDGTIGTMNTQRIGELLKMNGGCLTQQPLGFNSGNSWDKPIPRSIKLNSEW